MTVIKALIRCVRKRFASELGQPGVGAPPRSAVAAPVHSRVLSLISLGMCCSRGDPTRC